MASACPARARSHRLAAALAAQAVLTQVVLGDVLTPGARRMLRQRDAILFARRPFRAEAFAAVLAEGQYPAAIPGLWEIPPECGDARMAALIPDAIWDRLADPAALLRHVLNPRRVERLLDRLRLLRPQLVVLCGGSAGLLAPHVAGLGLPVVWRVHAHHASRHNELSKHATDAFSRRWHLAASQAFAAGARIAARHVTQMWLTSEQDAGRFAEVFPPGQMRLMPDAIDAAPGDDIADPPTARVREDDPAALATALHALGLPSAAVARRPSALEEDEFARFNPWTRVLDWRFLVQGAGPLAQGRLAVDTGAILANAFITLHPRRRDLTEVDVVAVLPPGMAAAQVTALISVAGGETIRRRPPPHPVEEAAGLLALTPIEGQTELLAWARTAEPHIIPQPLEWWPPGTPLSGTPVPGATVLRMRMRVTNAIRAVAITPEADDKADGEPRIGQTLPGPHLWTRTPPPSSQRLTEMSNRHRGETAWLIGNGPSVRIEDLDALDGRLTFGFNRFHLAHGRTRLRPHYTVTGDPQMIADFGQEIVDESGGAVFVADATPPALKGDHIWVRQMGIFPPLFSLRADRQVSTGGSSVYVALQLGYLMGVRRFFLYGTDLNFTFAPTERADGMPAAMGEGNHFIEGYRSGRPWLPPALREIMTAFATARRIMELEGGFIRNASRGGALEIFDRQPFEVALAVR